MRISVTRGGGFGPASTTTLDSDALDAEAARALRAQVARADLAGLAARRDPPPTRHPDELLYDVTVEDGTASQSLRRSESVLPEDVRALIAWVDARPERQERIDPV
jgi:hypothetical protein